MNRQALLTLYIVLLSDLVSQSTRRIPPLNLRRRQLLPCRLAIFSHTGIDGGAHQTANVTPSLADNILTSVRVDPHVSESVLDLVVGSN